MQYISAFDRRSGSIKAALSQVLHLGTQSIIQDHENILEASFGQHSFIVQVLAFRKHSINHAFRRHHSGSIQTAFSFAFNTRSIIRAAFTHLLRHSFRTAFRSASSIKNGAGELLPKLKG